MKHFSKDSNKALNIEIQKAKQEDISLIFSLLRDLAEFEGLTNNFKVTEDILQKYLFGEKSLARAIIGYFNGKPAGVAIFLHTLSTFSGKLNIFIEDIYVKPEYRKKGIGRAMFTYLARLAKEDNCGRLMWQVLDWNESAIKFYKGLGANPMKNWVLFEISESQFS